MNNRVNQSDNNNNGSPQLNNKNNFNQNAANILVVEDSLIHQRIVQKLFENAFAPARVNIIPAVNAAIAIEILRTRKIDLILMDHNLGTGNMNGAEACRIIKNELMIRTPLLTFSSSYPGKYPDADGRLDKTPIKPADIQSNEIIAAVKKAALSSISNINRFNNNNMYSRVGRAEPIHNITQQVLPAISM